MEPGIEGREAGAMLMWQISAGLQPLLALTELKVVEGDSPRGPMAETLHSRYRGPG